MHDESRWRNQRDVTRLNCPRHSRVPLPAPCDTLLPMPDVTRLLDAAAGGDPQAASALLPLVYAELRNLAAARLAKEKAGHTLQPTALVHEAYVRLVGGAQPQDWDGRGHFFAAAAESMRRILVEAARRKGRARHGGGGGGGDPHAGGPAPGGGARPPPPPRPGPAPPGGRG